MTPSSQALAAAREIEANHVWGRMETQRIEERAAIIDRHFHTPNAAWNELAKQTGDLLFQMECAATMGLGFASNHPMLKDVRRALDTVKTLKP